MSAKTAKRFTMAVVQFFVGQDKCENLRRAVAFVRAAVQQSSRPQMVVLPECFNSPYGTHFFKLCSEQIPCGETSIALSNVARECGVYVVGGSIPECESGFYYNTCTVWNPCGQLIAKYRKIHLFDIDIPGGMSFKESDVLSPGNCLTTFQTDCCKIGIGICYDLRFEEMARLYRNLGCDMILYPGAFNMTTGPLHWDQLLRARAVDNQLYVAGIAPATDTNASYVSYGHSIIISPWGRTLTSAKYEECMLYACIDLDEVKSMREQIPTDKQRRHDIYETVNKLCSHCVQLPCKQSTKCVQTPPKKKK